MSKEIITPEQVSLSHGFALIYNGQILAVSTEELGSECIVFAFNFVKSNFNMFLPKQACEEQLALLRKHRAKITFYPVGNVRPERDITADEILENITIKEVKTGLV